MADFYTGDVVYTTDRWHGATRRPHLVITVKGDRIGIVPLTHTRQGQYEITGLGGGTYIAARHFRTGRPNTAWATVADLELGRRQLDDAEITAALAETRRQLAA